MANPNKITVTVVVNGRPYEVEANINTPIQVLMLAAINESNSPEKNLDKWKLTTEGGEKLDPSAKIGAAGIAAGMTLLLNPMAGAAG